MKKQLRLSTLCLTLISIPFFTSPINSFAISAHQHHVYNNGYDDGYEDGYDDAMDDCPCPPKHYILGGFYVGAGVGYEGFQIQRKPSILDSRIGMFNTHANGWNGRIYGGYGRYFDNNLYLGGELFAGISGASGKDSITNSALPYSGKFSAGGSYGASVLPGYKFTNDGPLVYARLGYISTNLKTNDSSGTLSTNSSNWTSGFNSGLGLEVPLYKNFSGRLEYDYIKYSSFNPNGNVGSSNAPSDNRGSLDILYHFK